MSSRFTVNLQQSRQLGAGEEKIHKSLAWDSKSRNEPHVCSQLVCDGQLADNSVEK